MSYLSDRSLREGLAEIKCPEEIHLPLKNERIIIFYHGEYVLLTVRRAKRVPVRLPKGKRTSIRKTG